MQVKEAITAFSQSEKIKAGLLWATQLIEVYKGLPESDKHGSELIIKTIIGMIGHEIHLAKASGFRELWVEAQKSVDTSQVMANSNVMHESGFHLTLALSQVTSVGQRSLSFLIEKGLM